MLSAQQLADAPRGAQWPTCPLGVYTPGRRLYAHSPVHNHAGRRGGGGGHDAPGCTRERGAALPEVPQDCRVGGGLGDFPVLSLPDLLAPPSPPLQGLEGQAMETIALAEDEVR